MGGGGVPYRKNEVQIRKIAKTPSDAHFELLIETFLIGPCDIPTGQLS